MAKPARIVIVGGGITGLVAAYTLYQNAPEDTQITLLEASKHLGGKIRSIRFAGMPVDAGAEAVLLQDDIRAFLRELDLQDALLAPRASRTNIWTRGSLRPLPAGLVMGVPTDLLAIARSGIVSLPGLLRAGLDLLLPRTHLPADPTVAQVIGARFGRDVLTHLVEPLLGGIHAGSADRLSLAAVAPHILVAARKQRSLLLGLRSLAPRTPSPGPAGPQLYSLTNGLGDLVERLRERLNNVDIRLGCDLRTLDRLPAGTYRLLCSDKTELLADRVVLAVPAWETGRLLRELDPAATRLLEDIEYASVMAAHLAYRRSAFAHNLQGSGFLVPRNEGRLLNACTWVTQKWARQGDEDLVVLRCSAGRAGDERAARMSDDELLEAMHGELREALGVRECPQQAHITRWTRAFPQYNSGYQARIKQVEDGLAERLPGLILAGASYHGVGLAACLRDGLRVAGQIQQGASGRISEIPGEAYAKNEQIVEKTERF